MFSDDKNLLYEKKKTDCVDLPTQLSIDIF